MSDRTSYMKAENDNDDMSLSSIYFLSFMAFFGFAAFLLVDTAFQMTGAMNEFMGFDPLMGQPTFLKGDQR